MAERSPCSGPAIRDAADGRSFRLMRCGAVFACLLIFASVALAQSSSAPMAVSVTVVRGCAVGAGTVGGSLTLSCSNGVSSVAVASGARSSIQPLVSGVNTLLVDASKPLVVTLNF